MEDFFFFKLLALFCAIRFCCIQVNCDDRNDIYIIDNGYRDLLIAINSKVPENDTLIPRIKEAFTSGSEFLFNATRRRAFWESITILVPKKWTPKPEYLVATGETFKTANIVVDEPHPDYGNNPYTKQPGKCGKRGKFIHLTPDYLLDKTNSEYIWGPEGKLLVHEWAHLRYGVFDEYALGFDESGIMPFYFSSRERIEATRCTLEVTGRYRHGQTYQSCLTDSRTGLPEEDCVYFPDLNGQTATGSIMYAQFLDSIGFFCHDNESDPSGLHNREAPNRQNKYCKGRSTWDVITSSDDFKDGNKFPEDAYVDTTPDFRIVQRLDRRVVLVLDTSGSMLNDQKLEKMLQAATNYLQYTIDKGSYVGIVEFASTATRLSDLMEITNQASRNELIDKLPDNADGGTSIGAGILEGIEVLGDSIFESTNGGYLLVLSDGEENEDPRISDVLDDIRNAGVIVDTIAFTSLADSDLTQLSDTTGGLSFYYSGEDDTSALNDAFTATVYGRPDEAAEALPVQLISDAVKLNSSGEFIGTVNIDSSLGNDTRFTFSWTLKKSSPAIEVNITDPKNIEVDRSYFDINEDLLQITVSIPDSIYSQTGQWTFKIKNVRSGTQTVTYSVESKPSSVEDKPIEVNTYLSDTDFTFDGINQLILYAEVIKDYRPVLEAEVRAIVETPLNTEVSIYLFDNGAGADNIRGDGIYSAYFLNFDQNTRYGLQVQVTGSGSTVISEGSYSPALPLEPSTSRKKTLRPAGEFVRVTSGGLFEVSGYEEYVANLPPGASSDIYPPSQINDLRVDSFSDNDKSVTLRWTAPGDDLDQGIAAEYDLRIANSTATLYDSFEKSVRLGTADLVKGDLFSPKEAGQTETVVVKVDQLKSSYAFAIRAVDEAGNVATDASNVAMVTLGYSSLSTGLAWWAWMLIVVAVLVLVTVGLGLIVYGWKKTDSNVNKIKPSGNPIA